MSTPDRIYKVCAAESGAVIENLTIDPRADGLSADQFEDIYKFSDKHGITHRNIWVLGAGVKENAIDINNRCSGLLFEDVAVMGGNQSGVLIKGGCRDVVFRKIVFGSCGPRCDVLIGDWSDQSNDKTTGVVLDRLIRSSKDPVRVIVGRGDWPEIIGGNVKILYFQSYLQKVYWWIKFATRKLFGGKLAFLMPCVAVGLMLSGCEPHGVPVAPASVTVLTPINDQAEALRVAAKQAAQAQAARDSKLGASAEVIARQNEQAPASPQKPVIAAEAGLLQRILGVAPSPEDRASAAERETLMLSGKLSQASQLYQDASKRADELNAQIAAAFAQRDMAMSQLSSAIEGAKHDLATQQAKHDADMVALKAEYQKQIEAAHNEVMRQQVAWFNRIGAGCEALAIAAIGLAFFFGGLLALRKVAPVSAFLSVSGLLCFGLAQIIGLPWFKWACLGSVAIVVAWVGVWLYRHYKQGDLKQEADARLGKVTATLGAVVPVLDQAYENADQTVRDLLDKTIFNRLSDVMKSIPEAKATIHEIRAIPTPA